MKFAWISDCHFDCVPFDTIKAFALHTARLGADAILLTGDITTSKQLDYHLRTFASNFPGKIYFTLGNHDIYYSTVTNVNQRCIRLSSEYPNLVYMDESGVSELTKETCLVGNMGFYDCKAGSKNSNFILTDFSLNHDLRGCNSIPEACKRLVELLAVKALKDLQVAANTYSNVYFGTHVPPFVESSLYQGKLSEPDAQPYFVNVTFGDMLLDVASTYKDVKFTVFCGHTHHEATYQPLPNLLVHTAYAEYGYPAVWRMLEV